MVIDMGHQTYSVPKGVHPLFDPGPLDGPQSRVLTHIDHLLTQATEWEATLLNVRDKLTKELSTHIASLGYGVPDEFYKQKTASLEEALDQLVTGVAPNAGVIPALSRTAGKPGLADTQGSVTALRQLREDYQRRQAIDPNKTSVYRLTKGKHVHDGRLMKPGDTVTLTLRQFDAFKDKFEPASPAKAVTTKPRHTTEVVMEKRAKRRRH